jgi:uncharacterized membrane protein YhaH (DUF805 family)
MGGYLRAMKRYGVFGGRATRGEFWWFTVVLMALAFVALVIDGAVAQENQAAGQHEPGGIVTAIIALVHLFPSFAVTVRRLHDTNRTGWLVLLNLIPPLNLIILALVCLRGTPGPNSFGPDPLAMPGEVTERSTSQAGTSGARTVTQTTIAGPARHDLIAELERLGRLRKEGHLSDAEFEVMKAEALAHGRVA